jgi:hypothetical protein
MRKTIAAFLVVLAIFNGVTLAATTQAEAHYLPNSECIEYYPWNELRRTFLRYTSGKAWYWVTWANVSTGSIHKDTCFEFHV